jgi:hypothetical protein
MVWGKKLIVVIRYSPSAFVVSPAGQLQLDAEADVFTVTMIVDDRWLFSELKQRVFEALAPVDPQVTSGPLG